MDTPNYLATLGIRPAEISGLKELPGHTKDKLIPLVLLAPWMATTPLSRSIDKFEESYPSRPYFIDVDTYYQINDTSNEAKKLWSRLSQAPADLNAWWKLLKDYPNANPCLLMAKQTIEQAQEQINWAREMDREFCLRMNLAEGIGSGIPEWMLELMEKLAEEGADNYMVVFEFGWVRDPLRFAAEVIGYTKTFFPTIPPRVPIAISCTSFPKDFSFIDGLKEVGFTNRQMIAEIENTTDRKIIYADWGTTRPRSYDSARAPKRRIDYPTDNSWIFVREDDEDDNFFRYAAKTITESGYWSNNLGIWGEQLIEDTAEGQDFGIKSMQRMYAARINIHLHRQAFYDDLPSADELDDNWEDADF